MKWKKDYVRISDGEVLWVVQRRELNKDQMDSAKKEVYEKSVARHNTHNLRPYEIELLSEIFSKFTDNEIKYIYKHLNTDPDLTGPNVLDPEVPGPEVRTKRNPQGEILKVFVDFKKRVPSLWHTSIVDAISQCRLAVIHEFQKGPVEVRIPTLDLTFPRDVDILAGLNNSN